MSALGVEDGVEAGDEHIGWNVRTEHLVGLSQHLPWHRNLSLSHAAQEALRAGHEHCCWDPFAGDISYDEAYAPIRKKMNIVEVPANLGGRLIVRSDLPALKLGEALREQGMLD